MDKSIKNLNLRTILWLSVLLTIANPSNLQANDCSSDLSSISNFKIILQSPPPSVRGAVGHYKNLIYATQNNGALNRNTEYAGWYFMWVNRCHGGHSTCSHNQKGNPYRSLSGEGRAFFSTLDSAHKCTLIQLSKVLGYDWEAIGRKILSVTDRADGNISDTCVVTETLSTNKVDTIVLDYEVQDNRSEMETVEFIKQYSKFIRDRAGKRLFLYLNPINNPGALRSGIGRVSLEGLSDYVDYFGVLITKKMVYVEDDIRTQLAYLPSRALSKIVFVVDLYSLDSDDMKVIRAEAIKLKIESIMLWRNGTTFGDNCNTRSYLSSKCLLGGYCD